jgi:hypothetical protein
VDGLVLAVDPHVHVVVGLGDPFQIAGGHAGVLQQTGDLRVVGHRARQGIGLELALDHDHGVAPAGQQQRGHLADRAHANDQHIAFGVLQGGLGHLISSDEASADAQTGMGPAGRRAWVIAGRDGHGE